MDLAKCFKESVVDTFYFGLRNFVTIFWTQKDFQS